MKILSLLAIVCVFSTSPKLFAQNANSNHSTDYSNTVNFLFGDFFIPETTHNGHPITQIGLSYNRRVYKNYHIGIAYLQWTPHPLLTPGDNIKVTTIPVYPYVPVIGRMEYRGDYKMIDLYVLYRLGISDNGGQKIDFGIGATHNWGIDGYLKSYVQGSVLDAEVIYENVKENYWGIMPFISYNYFLLKNKVCLGADVRARFYQKWPQPQIDYGLHIGVNF